MSEENTTCQLKEVVQKLFESALEEKDCLRTSAKAEFPLDQVKKMADFAATYCQKFQRKSQEYNMVLPQMAADVERLENLVFDQGTREVLLIRE